MGFQDGSSPLATGLRLAIASLTAFGGALCFSPAAGAASTTCSATAVRAGSLSTPTANAAGRACQSANSGFERAVPGESVRVLGGDTTARGSSGAASADVLRVADAGTSGPTRVRLLGSDAYVTCRNGRPVIVGGSSPASVDTTAQTGSVYAPQGALTVPGLVYVNETERGAHENTYRALRVGPANGGIVAGESSAGYTGNPC